jgi:hypothetical protein
LQQEEQQPQSGQAALHSSAPSAAAAAGAAAAARGGRDLDRLQLSVEGRLGIPQEIYKMVRLHLDWPLSCKGRKH